MPFSCSLQLIFCSCALKAAGRKGSIPVAEREKRVAKTARPAAARRAEVSFISRTSQGLPCTEIDPAYVIFVWALKAIFQPSPRFRNTRKFQLVGFAPGFRP